MSELLNNVRSRIESLGIGFQFVKRVKILLNPVDGWRTGPCAGDKY